MVDITLQPGHNLKLYSSLFSIIQVTLQNNFLSKLSVPYYTWAFINIYRILFLIVAANNLF